MMSELKAETSSKTSLSISIILEFSLKHIYIISILPYPNWQFNATLDILPANYYLAFILFPFPFVAIEQNVISHTFIYKRYLLYFITYTGIRYIPIPYNNEP